MRGELHPGPIEEIVLYGLPEEIFGVDGWATSATNRLAEELVRAVRSGCFGPFSDAVRIVAHVPSSQHVRAIANAVCDAATTLVTASNRESSETLQRIGELRKGANEILNRTFSAAVAAPEPSETVTACNNLLHLVAVSRPELRTHLDAVSALAVTVGRELDLTADISESIRLSALLHDIGHLTTGTDPALAERDPGHAALGDRVLAGIEPLRHLAPVVRAHHERFDGKGQPDGLRGAEIPIEARLIAVADRFEHLANRPGRTNPIVAAVSDLWQDAGSAYDPDVVAAVTRVFNQHWRIRRAASGAP